MVKVLFILFIRLRLRHQSQKWTMLWSFCAQCWMNHSLTKIREQTSLIGHWWRSTWKSIVFNINISYVWKNVIPVNSVLLLEGKESCFSHLGSYLFPRWMILASIIRHLRKFHLIAYETWVDSLVMIPITVTSMIGYCHLKSFDNFTTAFKNIQNCIFTSLSAIIDSII